MKKYTIIYTDENYDVQWLYIETDLKPLDGLRKKIADSVKELTGEDFNGDDGISSIVAIFEGHPKEVK